MQSIFIIASLAFAAAGPAYNYQPQYSNTNTFGVTNSNNQVASIQGPQFLQNALQKSHIFLENDVNLHQNQQQESPTFNRQNFGPNYPQVQQQQFNYQPIAPIVSKDIYVHVPPEEPEENYLAQQAPNLPPRKHYRIVFIKAPTEKLNKASLRISQAPVEEKTIIYVLSKKQDPLDLEAVFKNVAPTQPSKPEVYFIKYKTQEEAAHAQQTIQAQYDQLGGTSEISDEGVSPVTSVIGSLSNKQHISQSQDQFGSLIGSLSNEEPSSYLPPSH